MSDASGTTSWEYDARGQLTLETKVISGSTFKTGWQYNSAGMLASMYYPSNTSGGQSEQVLYSYLPQTTLDSMYVGAPPTRPTDRHRRRNQLDCAAYFFPRSYGISM